MSLTARKKIYQNLRSRHQQRLESIQNGSVPTCQQVLDILHTSPNKIMDPPAALIEYLEKQNSPSYRTILELLRRKKQEFIAQE